MIAQVGNDVVDLVDAGAPSARFVSRALAPAERALVEQAADPSALVWRLWAAKEAAYKLLARADHELAFAHRRFRVDPAAGVVEHEGRTVQVRWDDGDGLVACCAFTGAPPAAATATLEEAEAIDLPLGPREQASATTRSSRAVRLLAKRLLGELLGADDVEIVRPERRGPPEVWRRGAPAAGVALSLSHDGRFVGCAVALEPT